MGNLSPKVIAAAVLLVLMAGLWLRVFLRGHSGPSKVSAKTVQTPVQSKMAEEKKSLHILPVSLPVIPGRHDRVNLDPFVLDQKQWFAKSENPLAETSAAPSPDTDEQKHRANLQRISQRLVLEGVVKDVNGVPIKACVDGKILFQGSTIQIKENGEIYELKVIEICSSEIKLAWQVFTLTIKMPSSEWLD